MFEAEDRHWWYVGNHGNFLQILRSKNILGKGIMMLDAGCGTGGWLQFLKNSCDVCETGIDNRETALEYAGTRTGLNLVSGDINTYTFNEASFDLITCFDVIYHRDVDDEHVVRNFNKYLKNEGHLLLTVPAYSFLYGKHDRAVHAKKRYTRKQIRRLLEKNGFEIVKLSYSVCLLFPFALIKRIIDKVIPAKKGGHNELKMPGKMINRLFLSAMRAENFLLRYIPAPFGLSVLALAKKRRYLPDDPEDET
jgi:SAM-dependent methyltransferase